MSKRTIEGCYARLVGIRESIPIGRYNITTMFSQDYSNILKSLRENINDKFEGFDVDGHEFFSRNEDSSINLISNIFSMKLNQLIRYLEMVHQASSQVVQIGSIYNSIKDSELRSRCGDLLSAADHFDRVINQATQVLEERVRKLVPSIGDMTGGPLINKAINPEPSKSMIVFSSYANEQEGYASLFKGLIAAFRNPSHHKFLDTVTREQALQICAFIDNMLAALGSAQVSQPPPP